MDTKAEPPETETDIEHACRKIADLKPHPLQAEIFADLPDAEIDWLADSIDKYGLECPVEILPDNTIVAGNPARPIKELDPNGRFVSRQHALEEGSFLDQLHSDERVWLAENSLLGYLKYLLRPQRGD